MLKVESCFFYQAETRIINPMVWCVKVSKGSKSAGHRLTGQSTVGIYGKQEIPTLLPASLSVCGNATNTVKWFSQVGLVKTLGCHNLKKSNWKKKLHPSGHSLNCCLINLLQRPVGFMLSQIFPPALRGCQRGNGETEFKRTFQEWNKLGLFVRSRLGL